MLPPPLKSPSDYDEDDASDQYKADSSNDFQPSGLSSWEQFLGTKPRPETSSDSLQQTPEQQNAMTEKPPSMAKLPSIQDLFPPDLSFPTKNTTEGQGDSSPRGRQRQRQRQSKNVLSSPDGPFFTDSSPKSKTNDAQADSTIQPRRQQQQQQPQQQGQPALEGVLPVSDLFYRSSQSINNGDDQTETDDEELPFSAEQTDELAVDHNKVKVRRNQALESLLEKPRKMSSKSNNNSPTQQTKKSTKRPQARRKMVRRGMEMLVGGVPINADPPQRSIELFNRAGEQSWQTAISVNTRDFGPFFSDTCQHQLSNYEVGLFCEFWVHSALKWDVCPKDLKSIVQEYYKQNNDIPPATKSSPTPEQQLSTAVTTEKSRFTLPSSRRSLEVQTDKAKLRKMTESFIDSRDTANAGEIQEEERGLRESLQSVQEMVKHMEEMTKKMGFKIDDIDQDDSTESKTKGFGIPKRKAKPKKLTKREREAENVKQALRKMRETVARMEKDLNDGAFGEDGDDEGEESDNSPKGFGKSAARKGKKRKTNEDYIELLEGEMEMGFDLAISKNELEITGENAGSRGKILREVFQKGMEACLEKEMPEPDSSMLLSAMTEPSARKEALYLDSVKVSKMQLTDLEDGTAEVRLEFKFQVVPAFIDKEKAKQKMGRICDKIVDSGELSLSMAAVAEEETRWPKEFRDRIYEDFLFEEDDEDRAVWNESEDEENFTDDVNESDKLSSSTTKMGEEKENIKGKVSPAATANETVVEDNDDEPVLQDSRFLRGGPDGVFWDYSEANAQNAPFQGNLGHKLLEAMNARAKEIPPKVIAIGDVHGCIDELQDLVRQCDYHPGDLIVFLGDLVSKGPDSISVVQMSREIGAIGVRGNHDFEVIRWHQAIKSDDCKILTPAGCFAVRATGVDPPVVGSEHYHVASCLSKADVKWLYSLPWYIISKD